MEEPPRGSLCSVSGFAVCAHGPVCITTPWGVLLLIESAALVTVCLEAVTKLYQRDFFFLPLLKVLQVGAPGSSVLSALASPPVLWVDSAELSFPVGVNVVMFILPTKSCFWRKKKKCFQRILTSPEGRD